MSFFLIRRYNYRYYKFSISYPEDHPTALLGRGAFAPYKHFRLWRKSWRRANLFCPCIAITEGWSRPLGGGPQNERTSLRMSFRFGKSLQSRYFKFSIGFPHLAQRPFWAAPLLRRSSVLPKAKPRRRANSLRPSNLKNPRYPKKKHLLCRCFFFGAGEGNRTPVFSLGS